jgi:hypothetical protein
MIETYAVIKNDEIIQVYETSDGAEGAVAAMENEGLEGDLVLVPTPFEGQQGQAKAGFTNDWKLRPLRDRVADGLVTLPSDMTVDAETGEARAKTLREKIEDGTTTIEPWQRYDNEINEIVARSWPERIAAGVATYEEWLDAVARPYRNHLLFEADSIYCNPERWWSYSDPQKAAWSAYKQVLRDFPATVIPIVEDSLTIDWPSKPEENL